MKLPVRSIYVFTWSLVNTDIFLSNLVTLMRVWAVPQVLMAPAVPGSMNVRLAKAAHDNRNVSLENPHSDLPKNRCYISRCSIIQVYANLLLFTLPNFSFTFPKYGWHYWQNQGMYLLTADVIITLKVSLDKVAVLVN